MDIEIQLPKLGESILSATVVQWLKKVGDFVKQDEALLEVSTDKVNSEIPSPVSGVLHSILVQENEEVEVGHVLAIITTSAAPTIEYSPAILQLAKQEGLSLEELSAIPATGAGGRLSKRDVEHYLGQRKEAIEPPVSSDETVSRIKIVGLRKAIADAMIKSYQEIPHAALLNEIDVTELMQFIREEKEEFAKQHDCKLTLTSFLVKALALAVVQYPLLNASVDRDTIIVKHSVNVGVAVGVEHGVIVPVLKLCERKTVTQIAKEIALLAYRTHTQTLAHEDVRDGTLTLTNFGMTGTKAGFPIIRHPEVAIVGVGAVQKRPVVMLEDEIVVRHMMDLTLCFDHRVVDGLYGCGFINAVREHLQAPSVLMHREF